MKAKTIKAVLRKKFDELLDSIDDKAVRERMAKNAIVTGGSIVSLLTDEKVSDYDIYLRDEKTAETVAKYYVGKFGVRHKDGIPVPIGVQNENGRVRIVVKSSGVASEEGTEVPYEYFEGAGFDDRSREASQGKYLGQIIGNPGDVEDMHEEAESAALEADDGPKYRPVFLSSNAITLANKVQIVLRFYGEPEEIHKNYDFVHCTNYWTSWDDRLELNKEALESIVTKELRYVGSKYPICSVIRLRKFIQRGWRINAGQILKMAYQISELDLGNIEVLEDQLTGVDAAYFCQLVARLKEGDPEKVNAAYLVEVIDRLF